MGQQLTLFNHSLITEGIDDPETLSFCSDLHRVSITLHQGMPVIGPWMEARFKVMVRSWLPPGWSLSGPSQIFREDRPGIRSRSWDIVIHKPPPRGFDLPPPPSSDGGFPLLPAELVRAVIDTKTNFNDPAEYARQSVFNLMNNATESQLAFLGEHIRKIVITASSSRSPESMHDAGRTLGLLAFSLGRYNASLVSDGEKRTSEWRLERFKDGRYPLQFFKAALRDSLVN